MVHAICTLAYIGQTRIRVQFRWHSSGGRVQFRRGYGNCRAGLKLNGLPNGGEFQMVWAVGKHLPCPKGNFVPTTKALVNSKLRIDHAVRHRLCTSLTLLLAHETRIHRCRSPFFGVPSEDLQSVPAFLAFPKVFFFPGLKSNFCRRICAIKQAQCGDMFHPEYGLPESRSIYPAAKVRPFLQRLLSIGLERIPATTR